MSHEPAWKVERGWAASRAARPTVCKCGTPVLRGLDADVAAFTVSVDAEPIDQPDIPTGLMTFDLIGKGSGAALWRRTERHLTMENRSPIHREHQCAVAVQEPLAFEEAS